MLLIAGCLVKGAAAAVGGRVLRALLPLPHAADRAAPFGAGCASHSRRLSPRHSARDALASCSHWTPLATPTTTAVVVRVSVVAAVAAAVKDAKLVYASLWPFLEFKHDFQEKRKS